VEHNAFVCSLPNGAPLAGSLVLEIDPKTESANLDLVLKVHTRPAETPDNNYEYEEATPGFVHTLLHVPGEKVFFAPPSSRHYFLGLTVNKDMNTDLQNKMKASQSNRDYFNGLLLRFKNTWTQKGEAPAATNSTEADYLISCTGKDKQVNDRLLSYLATHPVPGPHHSGARRISFCTDRSLGFGIHFHDPKNGNLIALHLGKHGFAQPIAGDGWWGEYRAAAAQTRCGILLLNITHDYLQSAACRKELTGFDMDRICVYDKHEARIFKWDELVHSRQFADYRACLVSAVVGEAGCWNEKTQLSSMVRQLEHKDADVRRATVMAMTAISRQICLKPALLVLIRLLEDGDEGVRSHAAMAVGRIGKASRPAVPGLARLLEDHGKGVRLRAIEALGLIGQAAASTAPKLTKLLEDEDEAIRLKAVIALGLIGYSAASTVGGITQRLKDVSPDVRWEATTALANIGEAAAPATRELARLLKDTTATVRCHTAIALGRIGEGAALAAPELACLCDDECKDVRRQAAKALGQIGQRAAPFTPGLAQMLRDQDQDVQEETVDALCLIGKAASKAVPVLIRLLADKDTFVQGNAVAALEAIGEAAAPAVPELIGLLANTDTLFQLNVVTALGAIGEAAAPAVPKLRQLHMVAVDTEDDDLAEEIDTALDKILGVYEG